MKKVLILLLAIIVILGSSITVFAVNGNNNGDKYRIQDCQISANGITATVTNTNPVFGGYWRVQTNPAVGAPAADIVAEGTFTNASSVDITAVFTPQAGVTYWLLVFTNDPGIGDRVDKAQCGPFTPDDGAAGGDEENETPSNGAAGGELEPTEVITVEEVAGNGETVPMKKTGNPLLPGVLAALMIGGGLLERKLRK